MLQFQQPSQQFQVCSALTRHTIKRCLGTWCLSTRLLFQAHFMLCKVLLSDSSQKEVLSVGPEEAGLQFPLQILRAGKPSFRPKSHPSPCQGLIRPLWSTVPAPLVCWEHDRGKVESLGIFEAQRWRSTAASTTLMVSTCGVCLVNRVHAAAFLAFL